MKINNWNNFDGCMKRFHPRSLKKGKAGFINRAEAIKDRESTQSSCLFGFQGSMLQLILSH